MDIPQKNSNWIRLFGITLCLIFSFSGNCQTIVRDPSGSRPVTPDYFDLHVRWGATTYYWPKAKFYSWRVITGETSWYGMEKEKGRWQYDALDRAVERAEWKGVEVLYTLGYPPKWSVAAKYQNVWNPGIALPPNDIQEWEGYVRRVVERYKGRIKYYELMNEPHFSEVDRPHSKVDFPVATMVEMARTASHVIQQTDPKAKLISMSPSGRMTGVQRVAAFLKAGGGQYINALGFHFYTDTPEQIPSLVYALQLVLKESGQNKLEIWNTESGFYINDPDRPPSNSGKPESDASFTPEHAGGLVARALTLGAAAGLRRFYWYSWDIPSMALTEGKGVTVTPAGKAYIKTEQWLHGATISECRTSDDKLWVCKLSRGERTALMVWNTSGACDWLVPAIWTVPQYETLLNGMSKINSDRLIRVNESPILIVSDSDSWGIP